MKPKTAQLSDYLPPDSTEIERQILVDAVFSPDVIPELIPIINRNMFTVENRSRIWEMIVYMYNTGEQIDLVTMRAKCGQAFIVECVNPKIEAGGYKTILSHAKALRDISARRRAYLAAIRLLEKSNDINADETEIVDAGESVSREITCGASSRSDKIIDTIIDEISVDMTERKKLADAGRLFRVPSGIPSIDWLTYKGWSPGQLIILAARPSIGKTSLMLKMAKAGAAAGFPSTIFSLEMTEQELGQKLLFSTGHILPSQLAAANVSKEGFESAARAIKGLKIRINTESNSLDDIVSRIMIASKRGECKVAYIDYLGLIKTADEGKVSTNQSISIITRTLKATAKRAGIPIILLAQLNREMAKENRAPELYDLRDSGAIEQDADVVMMLEHTKYKSSDDGEESVPDINIWVRKNRQYKKDLCVVVRPNKTYSEFFDISNFGNK